MTAPPQPAMHHAKMSTPNTPSTATAASPASGFCPLRLQRLQDVLQAEVERQRLPGAVACIARHGQTALFESLGQLNPATATPMSRDAIFRIYSMTKPIVSVAAMMLAEQGRLLLSDPVSRYLPEFAAQQVCHRVEGHVKLQPVRRGATVQDLLRHTAGLTYEFLGSAPVQRQYAQERIGSRERSNAELSTKLASLPLMFEPGTTWEYSRATDVLGRILEVISGEPLGQFLQRQLFEPLGMHETWFNVPLRSGTAWPSRSRAIPMAACRCASTTWTTRPSSNPAAAGCCAPPPTTPASCSSC